jgi:hypothetical protein
VQSPKNGWIEDTRVCEFIDNDTKNWNRTLIESTFLPEEARTILDIPISPFLPRDKLTWRGTNNGEFSVRSAYHLGLEVREWLNPSGSGIEKDSEVWKAYWRLLVPPAVKMFDLLLTKTNLFRRKVCKDQTCPICQREGETLMHIIWECPSANDVWGSSLIKLQKCSKGMNDFSQLFLDIAAWCSKEYLCLFALTARKIWMRRNACVHGGDFLHPNIILKEAEAALEDFWQINNSSSRQEENKLEYFFQKKLNQNYLKIHIISFFFFNTQIKKPIGSRSRGRPNEMHRCLRNYII